jgi:coenzyme F420-0:L-glutamate ligase/coenzyme F420-1:gamma-L-glutamate ligase
VSGNPSAVRSAADLSALHVVVPVRTLEGGKARLGGALDAEEREELIVGMLARLLDAVATWHGATGVAVVTPDPALLALATRFGAVALAQPVAAAGLNEGLRIGAEHALAVGATAVLVLPADLPLVSADALARFALAADAAIAAGGASPLVAISPSDARGGTNVLLLSPPGVIEPAFGEASFAAHLRAAERVGATVQVVVDQSFGFDLDTPEDLDRLDPALLAELQGVGGAALGRSGRPDPAPGAEPAAPRLVAIPLPSIPDVRPGDDLAALLAEALRTGALLDPDLAPVSGDVLVVTQKVVSKAEGRVVDLRTVEPRPEAVEFARRWGRDARQVEVVLREATQVLRMERGVIITRTRHGLVCANSGVDASNVEDPDTVTLLPDDPDHSAALLRSRLRDLLGVDLAIVVTDSFGRPWRWGITDVAIGVAGFRPLDDLRGTQDTSGRVMQATVVAVADELACVAELASGKTSRRPAVLIRGVRLPPGDGTIRADVVMEAEADLFP